MKALGVVALGCAVVMAAPAPQAGAQQAAADKPVMCWDYNTLEDGAASRLGIRGTVDDTILSRAGYYNVSTKAVRARSPLAAGSVATMKVELRAEAEGAEAPLAVSGLLVEVDGVYAEGSAKGVLNETHTDERGSVHYLVMLPMVARFVAGGEVVEVPFKTQGRKLNQQDIDVRLGAYRSTTWPVGKGGFDPKATLPVIGKIDEIWKKAGSMSVELVLAEGGAPVLTTTPFAYFGDKAEAEFARMSGRATEMISGGKCKFLGD